jgi:hypothetical protein
VTPLIVNSRLMVSPCRRDRQQGDPPLSQRPSSGKPTCDAEQAQGLRKGNPPIKGWPPWMNQGARRC